MTINHTKARVQEVLKNIDDTPVGKAFKHWITQELHQSMDDIQDFQIKYDNTSDIHMSVTFTTVMQRNQVLAFNISLSPTLDKLDALHTWPEGWNSYNAKAPNPQAIAHARTWITELCNCVQEWKMEWLEPNVTADAEGEVVFEWWHKPDKIEHHLIVYIGPTDEGFMCFAYDGNAERNIDETHKKASEYREVWKWLVGCREERNNGREEITQQTTPRSETLD